ncbi:MAG: ABC transporter ATP-binding protein [Geminicoccaceae bacterium]|nr:ABC transporter ATP-binding protein [Geminicoccaceae bacterium]MDW8340109.1 ABC transporter ATP-binding protein [Geminicoccaceae bacterium]
MIDLEDVHLVLEGPNGPVPILRGIDLEVEAGTTASVVGPSGSGRSSLLAIIGGIERASRGRVVVCGEDLGRLDEDALARFRRRHVGFLFQAFHLVPAMTARENVALPMELAGRPRALARAAELLAEVGLAHRMDHFPAQLSGGEQQRVALARALANEPELLLADEPTGNLDAATGRAIVELLFAVRARHGATLVLVTHDARLAARCARRFVMDAGRLAETTAIDVAPSSVASPVR